MARLNEILVGRFNRVFQKVYGIKGPAPVSTLAPEIMPVHSIFAGIEQRYVDGWNRYAFATLIVATAAQTDAVLFRNPVGSNVIAVLERMSIYSGTAQEIILTMGPQSVDLPTTTFSGFPVDGRQTANSKAVLTPSISVASPAGLTFTYDRFLLQASVERELWLNSHQEICLTPGQAIQLTEQTVNTSLKITALWRERFLEEGERL